MCVIKKNQWYDGEQVDRKWRLRRGESAHASKGIPSLACKTAASGSAYKGDTFGASKLLQHTVAADHFHNQPGGRNVEIQKAHSTSQYLAFELPGWTELAQSTRRTDEKLT